MLVDDKRYREAVLVDPVCEDFEPRVLGRFFERCTAISPVDLIRVSENVYNRPLTMYSRWMPVKKKVSLCPFCGTSLQEPVELGIQVLTFRGVPLQLDLTLKANEVEFVSKGKVVGKILHFGEM